MLIINEIFRHNILSHLIEKVSRIIDQWRLNGDILVITGVIYFQHDVELEHPAIVFLWPI